MMNTPVNFSRRENEVIDLLMLGKSNKQIAFSLGVSERTVEFHLKNIYAKMQVSSRVELILKLGKTKHLVESTVDSANLKVHNGNQPADMRGTQAWKHLGSLIKKEVAMMIKISFKDLENYFKNHTSLFSLLVFFITSLMLRYILFGLGLYFWGSYVLLAALLLIASIRFGEMLNGTRQIRPFMTLFIAGVFPLLIAGLDQLYLVTFLRYTKAALISLPRFSTSAEWLTSPNGISYLSTTLSRTSDGLWVVAVAVMIVTFLLSRKFGKHSGDELVTA